MVTLPSQSVSMCARGAPTRAPTTLAQTPLIRARAYVTRGVRRPLHVRAHTRMEPHRRVSLAVHVALAITMVVWIAMRRDTCTARLAHNPPRASLRYDVEFVANGVFVLVLVLFGLASACVPLVRVVPADDGTGDAVVVFARAPLSAFAWPIEHVLRGAQATAMLLLIATESRSIEVAMFAVFASQLTVVFKFAASVAEAREMDLEAIASGGGGGDKRETTEEIDAAEQGGSTIARVRRAVTKYNDAVSLRTMFALHSAVSNLIVPIIAVRTGPTHTDARTHGLGVALFALIITAYVADVAANTGALVVPRHHWLAATMVPAAQLLDCALHATFVAAALACSA